MADEKVRWFCSSCNEWKFTPFRVSGQLCAVRCEQGHEKLVSPQKPADDVLKEHDSE